jgi:hypothetical protein
VPDLDDVCRIVRSLPDSQESEDGCHFTVLRNGKHKQFASVWFERSDSKKPRQPNPAVIIVRTKDLDERDHCIAAKPKVYFAEPDHDTWPAVCVRLKTVSMAELKKCLLMAWRCHAPKGLIEKLPKQLAR